MYLLGLLGLLRRDLLRAVSLPESPRFLVRHPARWPELSKLLSRMSRPVASSTVYVDAAEQKAERAGFKSLFETGRARDTIAIWCTFFVVLLAVYSAFSWLPTMLAAEGLSPAIAGSGLTAYNMGGVFGALLCAVCITRFGSRWPLALCCIGAAASAFILQGVDFSKNANWLIIGLGIHGLFVNAVQSTMYALCAYVYPTIVRATGTASALAFGRLGAILSSFAGAAIITAGGGSAYLTMLGTAMALAFVGLMLVKRHIPGAARARAAAAATEAEALPSH